MNIKMKITQGKIDKAQTAFQNTIEQYERSLKQNFNEMFFKIVKIEIMKEDLEKIKQLSKCEECKYYSICSSQNTHCLKLETIYIDYKMCNELNDYEDIMWKSKQNENSKNYFELENSHLENLIHFLYKNEMATLEHLTKKNIMFENQFEKIKNNSNKIRERMRIRVIRKVIELKNKYDMNNAFTLEQEKEFMYNYFMETKQNGSE